MSPGISLSLQSLTKQTAPLLVIIGSVAATSILSLTTFLKPAPLVSQANTKTLSGAMAQKAALNCINSALTVKIKAQAKLNAR